MSWLDPLLPAMLRPLYKDIGDDLREHPPAHVTPTQQNKLAAVKRAETAAKGKAVAQKASAKGKAGLIPFGIGHFNRMLHTSLCQVYFVKKNTRTGEHRKILTYAVMRKLEACTSLLLKGLHDGFGLHPSLCCICCS